MKAILLAGGKGTRLRPLTIHTPKPIVPIFNRPFLHYQIDLLKQVPEIDEVILSLNYQPRRIEEIFGDGSAVGISIRYIVEPAPLGTAGAVRYAGDNLTEVDVRQALKVAFESSPVAAVPTWKSPVLLIHGDDDRTVDFHQTVDLERRLLARGVKVETLVLPDDVHDSLLWRNWTRTISAMSQFFERTLSAAPPSNSRSGVARDR